MRSLILSLLVPLSLVGNQEWESTQLIWNFGIAASCEHGLSVGPIPYFSQEPTFDPSHYTPIKSGDILWMLPQFVLEFYEKVLPAVQTPFVLVICGEDHSFPSECLKPQQVEDLLANPYLIHVFAQNCDYQGDSSKVSPIPIGIDFHTVAYKSKAGGWGMRGSAKDQEALLLHHLQQAPPTSQRKPKAFVDFQHSDTMHASFQRYLQCGEDRTSIFKTLLMSGVIDHGKWMSRGDLWKTKREYAFSISPHGNGWDCHRTWEDLALGCIVIVKSSPIDSLYEGLPVVIVKDWNEVNEENLKRWMREYGDVSCNPSYRERLTHKYWMTKIKNAATPYRSNE